jgi:hypothetical protein
VAVFRNPLRHPGPQSATAGSPVAAFGGLISPGLNTARTSNNTMGSDVLRHGKFFNKGEPMLQKSLRIVGMAAVVAVLVGLAGTGMAWADSPSLIVDYYAGAGNAVFPTPFAGTLRLDNPGSVGPVGTSIIGGALDLWALIYVFDADQQLVECCGCKLTPDGLRVLDVNKDLTSNPNNGLFSLSGTGVIKVASSRGSNPGAPIVFTGTILGWGTHENYKGAVTETNSQKVSVSQAEANRLAFVCSIIQSNSSGAGICSCGWGD